MGDKLTEEDKAPVKAAAEKLKETLKGSDTEAIKADTDALEKAFHAVAEKMYQASGAADAQGGAQGPQGNDGTYYDADFEDKTN